jgi:hypothetical protein
LSAARRIIGAEVAYDGRTFVMADSPFLFDIRSAPRESEFDAQVEAIKQVVSWDPGSRSWYVHVDRADAKRLAKVTNHLFEVARQYGTFVRLDPRS